MDVTLTLLTAAPSPERELAGLLDGSGIPPRFRDRTFATFEVRAGTKTALEAARAIAELPPRRNLVLLGPPGCGKTHLAVSILAEVARQHLERYPERVVENPNGSVSPRPVLGLGFAVVPTLLDELRSRIAYGQTGDPLDELRSVSLLVLDDLGREKVSDWVHERLYVLVNERYNWRRPTIVTSNYTLPELASRGYDAVISRLSEDGQLVSMKATDYRGQA